MANTLPWIFVGQKVNHATTNLIAPYQALKVARSLGLREISTWKAYVNVLSPDNGYSEAFPLKSTLETILTVFHYALPGDDPVRTRFQP